MSTIPKHGEAGRIEDATIPLPPSPGVEAERDTLPLPGTATSAGAHAIGSVGHPLPASIGRFQVRGWLGSGAFGDVYRAYDPQLDREVALKVAKPGSLDAPERAGRFLREAKAAANLRHPNIVPLFETGRDADRLFIAAAFVPGRTLETVTQETTDRGEQIPLDVACRIVQKIAEALAYAHSQGVIHRDVKPANVMVDDTGEPHLLDFGLAARAESGDERLTQDGQGMGTPAYMAPEQAQGHGTAASDQYSLGCTLYELLTGQTPFAGGPAQQIYLHQTQAAKPPRRVNPGVPRDLDTVVQKCLEKEAARRYENCAAVAEDLRRWRAGEPVAARRVGPLERTWKWARRNPAVATSLALAFLAMAAGSAVSLWQRDQAITAAANEASQRQIADNSARRASEQSDRATKGESEARERAEDARRATFAATLQRAAVLLVSDPAAAVFALEDAELCPPDLRDFTWQYLRGQCRWEAATVRHPATVTAVAGQSDGKRAFSADATGLVQAWDPVTGTVLWKQKYDGRVPRMVVSPDSKWVAFLVVNDRTGGFTEVRHADGKRGSSLQSPRPTDLAFSPDGGKLAVVSQFGGVHLWDASTNKTAVGSFYQPFASVAFSSDGKSIAIGYVARTADPRKPPDERNAKYGVHLATLEQATAGRFERSLEIPITYPWTDYRPAIGFVPGHNDGPIMAVAAYGVSLTHLATRHASATSVSHEDALTGRGDERFGRGAEQPNHLEFAPDARLLTLEGGECARVFDVHSRREIVTLRRPTTGTLWTAAGFVGASVVVGGRDEGKGGFARVMSLQPPGVGDQVRVESRPLTLEFADDSKTLLTHSFSAPPRLFDCVVPGGRLRERTVPNGLASYFAAQKTPSHSATLSADGTTLATTLFRNTDYMTVPAKVSSNQPHVWNAATGTLVRPLTTAPFVPHHLTTDRSGGVLAGYTNDGQVAVWDTRSEAPPSLWNAGTKDAYLAISPDGQRVAVADWGNGGISVRDAVTGATLGGTRSGPVRGLRFTADGASIVAVVHGASRTQDDRDLRLGAWSWPTMSPVPWPQNTPVSSGTIAVSPDGRTLAVIRDENPDIRLLDPKTGRERARLRGHTNHVAWVAFRPDGMSLVSADKNGVIFHWHVGINVP